MGNKYILRGKVLSIDEKEKLIELKVDHKFSSEKFVNDDKICIEYEEEIKFPGPDIVGEEVECKTEIKDKKFMIIEIYLAGEED